MQYQFSDLVLHAAQTDSSLLKLDQILGKMAEAMVTAARVPYCGIYLMERGMLVPHTVRGPLTEVRPGVLARPLDPTVDSLVGQVLQRQEPVVCYDVEAEPCLSRETVLALSVKSVLAVPLRVREQASGVAILGTSSDVRHFTPSEIDLVWGIANSVALAVDSTRLYQEARQRLSKARALSVWRPRCSTKLAWKRCWKSFAPRPNN